MITSSKEDSLNQLKLFFTDKLANNELELLDLIHAESDLPDERQNAIILNQANPNIKNFKAPNLEQAPYSLILPNLQEVNLTNLKEVEFDNSSLMTQQGLYLVAPPQVLQGTKIKKLILPNFLGTRYPTNRDANDLSNNQLLNSAFINNNWLQEVELGNEKMKQNENSAYWFNGYWFYKNYFLRSLQLNYPYVIPIMKVSFFLENPIINGDGYIFVPENLLENYQNADGWSSLRNKIKSINQKDTLIPKEIEQDWSQIISDCRKNENLDQYQLGDVKTVIRNGIPVPYTIVGINSDTIDTEAFTGSYVFANGAEGKAHLTWMELNISDFKTKNLAEGTFNNNASYNNATNFHSILNSIYSEFEETVKNGIVPVIKYSKGYDPITDSVPSDYEIRAEKVWAPSAIELKLSPQYGKANVRYDIRDIYHISKKINYCFGYTNINQENNNFIKVALRDYSSKGSTSPDVLQASTENPNQMASILPTSASAYVVTGFCT